MPIFKPEKMFEGQDVYIIGGGPSLANFNWTELEDKNTIGCNSAFRLGGRVCNICMFSDCLWFEKFYKELSQYTGILITHYPKLKEAKEDWLHWMERGTKHGLYSDKLCYGGNTGCGAINLALLMGAQRVLLLGFDLKPGAKEEQNWHEWQIEEVRPQVHDKHLKGFEALSKSLPEVFPGREIINLTEGSRLTCFPFSKFKEEKKVA